MLYAIKILRQHGMNNDSLQDVFMATVMGRITYALNSWRLLASGEEVQRINKIIRRACKLGYCPKQILDFDGVAEERAKELFRRVVGDRDNVLHRLLPPEVAHNHETRAHHHNMQLPIMKGAHDSRNFMIRLGSY